VAGHQTLPLYVQQGEGSFRPELAAWISPLGVLAASPAHPDEVEPTLLGLLEQATFQPLVGGPGRPAAVRVSDPRLALSIAKALGPDVAVRVAPTPELEALALHFVNHLDEEDPAPERLPWVDDGLDPALVRGFFEAAAALYRAAPWTVVPGEWSLLAVDAPALSLEGACLSIIGGAGEELGFLLFDSVAGFETMRQAGLRYDEESAPLTGPGASIFSVSFETGSQLPKPTRTSITRQGLPVANAKAYPLLLLIDPDNVSRPPTDDDVVRGWALCEALARLTTEHPKRLASERGAPLRQTYAVDGPPGRPTLTLTLPHPDDEATSARRESKPAVRETARKAPAKKAVANKAPAKKAVAKKAVAKKAVAKKAVAKKAVANKAVAKSAPSTKITQVAPSTKSAKHAKARKTAKR
jgi:hypothetical protein